MCGLIGFVGKHPDLAVLKHLFLATVDCGRGKDGWGVMTYAPQHGAYMIRDNAPPKGQAIDQSLEELHASDASVILGHIRMATSGTRSPECNHPLTHKHAVVVHNGYVENHEELREQYKVPNRAPSVDSYIIAYLIGESETVSEGITKVLKECSGKLTFMVWSSKAPFTLWTVSDEKHNLYQFRYRGQDYFASEPDIFKAAVTIHKAGYKKIPAYRESYGLGGALAWGASKVTQVMELSEVWELKKRPKVKTKVYIPHAWAWADREWGKGNLWLPASHSAPHILPPSPLVKNKEGKKPSHVPDCEFCYRPGPIKYQDVNLCEECFELLAK